MRRTKDIYIVDRMDIIHRDNLLKKFVSASEDLIRRCVDQKKMDVDDPEFADIKEVIEETKDGIGLE